MTGGEPDVDQTGVPGPAETVPYGRDDAQVYDVRLPGPGTTVRPSVVLIHGGFWRERYDREHVAAMAQSLAEVGHPTAVLEYRRTGTPASRHRTILDDIQQGFSVAAADSRLPPPRIVVGHSAGGQLALWLAAQPDAASRMTALVSLAGCVDLGLGAQLGLGGGAVPGFLGGTLTDVPEVYADADPVRLLPCGVPTVLIHGDADPEVPLEVSESYLAHARRAGSEASLVRLPGVGHYELINPAAVAFTAVLEGIDRVAGRESASR